MSRTYLDTSALRHVLLDNGLGSRVDRVMTDSSHVCTTSDIAVTELLRLATRYPDLDARHVDALLAHIDLVPVTLDQLRAAGLLPGAPAGAALRSLDAIHIQAALDAEVALFLTSDVRQARAAEALGLRTEVLA